MKTLKSNMKIALVIALSVLTISCDEDKPKRTSLGSPQGNVPFGDKAYSPDFKMYAREVDPRGHGQIGIYDAGTDKKVRLISVKQSETDEPNDLKGIAWSLDGKSLAVMYHHDNGGHVSIMSTEIGMEVKRVLLNKQPHSLEFSPDGTKIVVGGDSIEVK